MKTWNQLIPQLCLTEPAIAYTGLAISALFEDAVARRQLPYERSQTSAPTTAERYALKYYVRAIQEVQHLLQSDDENRRLVALVASIMFISLEAMRGQSQAAVTHIRSALRIAYAPKPEMDRRKSQEIVSAEKDGKQPTVVAAPADPTQVAQAGHTLPAGSESLLIRSSLVKLAILIGSAEEQTGQPFPADATALPSQIDPCPSNFHSADEARGMLFSLLTATRSVVFGHEQSVRNGQDSATDEALERCVFVDTQLHRWSAALHRFLHRREQGNSKDPSNFPEPSEIVLWQAWCKYASVRISGAFLPSKASLNALTPDMEALLHLCERCLNLHIEQHARRLRYTEKRAPIFVMDLGVLAILWYVGQKATSRHVRLEALRLVGRAPRRESLWDAETVRNAINESMQKDPPLFE
ncbi:MAG: hypothetical protein Q9162_001170 [Coniocarpon cinnabarinum]